MKRQEQENTFKPENNCEESQEQLQQEDNPSAGESPSQDPEAPPPDELDKCLQQLQQEKETLHNRLLRQQADFENYRRRVQSDQDRWADEAVARFAGRILPVVDNLERALEAADSNNPLTKGVEMVYRQLLQALEQEGITPLQAVGQPFDPRYHQAVQREEKEDTSPETVLEEYQKGYIYKGKVIRPSMVKVSG